MTRRLIASLLAGVLLFTLVAASTGCSMKMGQRVPSSQFIFPNSNVKPLGPAKASTKKFGFFSPPTMGLEMIKGTYNQALSKAEGANLLINYNQDVTFTMFPFPPLYWITYSLEGEAARMDVGTQKLH